MWPAERLQRLICTRTTGDGRMVRVQTVGQTNPSSMNESSRWVTSILEAAKQKIDSRNDSDAVYVRRVIAVTDDKDLLVTGSNPLERF